MTVPSATEFNKQKRVGSGSGQNCISFELADGVDNAVIGDRMRVVLSVCLSFVAPSAVDKA